MRSLPPFFGVAASTSVAKRKRRRNSKTGRDGGPDELPAADLTFAEPAGLFLQILFFHITSPLRSRLF
jgi:hypothetical protein